VHRKAKLFAFSQKNSKSSDDKQIWEERDREMHPVEKPEPIDMGTTSIFERKQLV
jgi:hypothetical protein